MRAVVLIVALLALGAVALYAVQVFPARIESDLKQRSTQALNAANLTFAKVSVAGRVITLSGEAPGPSAKEEAVKVAGDVWGVSNVQDSIVVSTAGLPVAPQEAIEPSMPPSDNTTAPEPAAPPVEEPSTSALPTVGSLVDPALDSSSAEPEPQETPPAPEEPRATETLPPQPAPAETTAASPPPPESSATPPVQQPEPAPTAAPPAPQPEPAPVQTPPPQVVAQATPPSAPPAAAPAPPGAPIGPLPKEAMVQGVTAGLNAALQSLPQAVEAVPPAYRLEAHVAGNRIELQGLVSTPSAQRALIADVRRRIRRAEVVDSLKVAHAKPDKDWLGVARTGLAQLAHLDTGSLKLDGHSVAVSGKPKSEKDRSRVLAALSELPRGYTSTVLLERTQPATPAAAPIPAPAIAAAPPAPEPVRPAARPHPAAPARPARTAAKPAVAKYRTAYAPPPVQRGLSSACRRRFNDVLPRVAVAFESGSTRVQSAVGIDDLARIARQCQGAHLLLSGHSDTQETAPAAIGLSLRRALSVREELEDRGVSAESITVTGRGGLRPAFSNATADGRENNRRVEFSVW